jgi:hypothetical protein
VIPCSRRTHFTSLAQVPAGLHRTRVSEMRVSRARGAAPSMFVSAPSAHPSFSTPGHSMASSTASG